MNRTARVERNTKESQVLVELNLDGSGASTIDTGVPFFDHMLAQLAKHGGFDLVVATKGDLEVDSHHTVEDTALALGQAMNEALGDRAGLWCSRPLIFRADPIWCMRSPRSSS